MAVATATFEEQAREYVNAIDYMTSGEAALCSDMYHEAERADADVERAAQHMAVAQAKRSRQMYADAHAQKRAAFENGRDAVSHIRSLIRNANARRAAT